MLYPDLGACEKWNLKVTEIHKQFDCKISNSKLLENEATYTDRTKVLDIADYIIDELKAKAKTLNNPMSIHF